jgi:hypothetical protein
MVEEESQLKMPSQPGNLREIPGVGPSIARDLHDLGVRHVQDLCGADPEQLYRQLCTLRDVSVDRCVLYVFRCAVYYADNREHDAELLKWWNWKDPESLP